MTELVLRRFDDNGERTLGNLQIDVDVFPTIERPWIFNPNGKGGMPMKSCVPIGQYELRPHSSPKFGEVYALHAPNLGVWEYSPPAGEEGRSLCLLHPANFVEELLGCIAPSMQHGKIGGEDAVLNSREAMAKIRQLLGKDIHILRILTQ